MPHVVDTNALVAEGVLTEAQAADIARRSRETMLALVVNAVLTGGIIAAALGFVFWIADPAGVAILGAAFLAVGLAILLRGAESFRMIGHSGTLIGAGMLLVGGSVELLENYRDIADGVMALGGAAVAAAAALLFARMPQGLRFSLGSVALMGLGVHLTGSGMLADDLLGGGIGLAPFWLYAAGLIAATGLFLDVRLVTALAIFPFAQALETGTGYFHAAYVFYSPEPTLTILQMSALVAACLYVASRTPDRTGRHAGILAIMAVVVGNLAFLVGSLWGDAVGLSFFRDQAPAYVPGESRLTFNEAYEAWEATFFHISEDVFSIVWAALLLAAAWAAAAANRRGLFNAAVTFGAIHAYTQAFQTFGDEPMAYALGGLAAIPVAWGMWRLNKAMFGEARLAA